VVESSHLRDFPGVVGRERPGVVGRLLGRLCGVRGVAMMR
jgi:hypothetical protein